MLKSLHLKNAGPAPEMEMELGERLNLITGDNGLGKSFLLDVTWWALTRRWPQDLNSKLTSGYPARPTDPKKPATIEFHIKSKTKRDVSYTSTYSQRDESWVEKAGRPWNPGLVIYAYADGGFSVWGPGETTGRRVAMPPSRIGFRGMCFRQRRSGTGSGSLKTKKRRSFARSLSEWLEYPARPMQRK